MRRFENIEGMLKEIKMLTHFGSQSRGISHLYIPPQKLKSLILIIVWNRFNISESDVTSLSSISEIIN